MSEVTKYQYYSLSLQQSHNYPYITGDIPSHLYDFLNLEKTNFGVHHDWCRTFDCILTCLTELKFSVPKTTPFHDTFRWSCKQTYAIPLSEKLSCRSPMKIPFQRGLCAVSLSKGVVYSPYFREACLHHHSNLSFREGFLKSIFRGFLHTPNSTSCSERVMSNPM